MSRINSRPGLEVETIETVSPMNTTSPSITRSPSMAVSPTGSLLSTPFVSPEPAYIAAKEAAFIITREVLVEFHQADESDLTQMHDSSLSQISPSSMGNVNAFLDRILLNILSNARSLSLVSLRPAVRDVLRPKLAQEAIAGADEELIECIGEDDEADLFEDAQETQDASWDLDAAWKRARLRCMVYTRLGDMEEEDEDRYIGENGLDNFSDGQRLARNSSIVSPPVAIWLTAVLEFIGENVLMVASHAAYKRCESKYGRGIAGQALHPSVVLVGDNDLEKIALSPTLGRLWRAWRKPIRSPKTSISRALSIDSMRHRRGDSRSTAGFTKKASSETLSSSRPEATSKRGSVEKELPAPVDPASIPLPISDFDIDEIEVPGFTPSARKSRPTSIPVNNITAITKAFQELAQGGPRRLRANSLIMTNLDLIFPDASEIDLGDLITKAIAIEKDEARESERGVSRAASTNEEAQASSRASSELRVPQELTEEQKRSSTVSQKRRSKRLSYQSGSDRKSGVSEYGGPGGPVLFSRSDYRLTQNEAEQIHDIPSDVPSLRTEVIVPTPTADVAPVHEKSNKKRLSATKVPRNRHVRSADDDGYESGEISPLEPSDDEGSGQIAGLEDARQHMGIPHPESVRHTSRPVSMIRPVSPLVEATKDEEPVSPISPEDHTNANGWIGSDFEVSPTEQRRRSTLLPAASTAPSTAPVPALAPAPVVTAAASVAAAEAIANASVLAPQSRSSQSSTKRESDERKREAMVLPGAPSSDVMGKEMPDLPREAQFDMLTAAAVAHANVAVPQPDSLYQSMSQKSAPAQGDGTAYPGRPSYEQSAPPPPAKEAQKSNAPEFTSKPSHQKSNAPDFAPKPVPQKSNAPQIAPKPVAQTSNAPQVPSKSIQKSNAPQTSSMPVSVKADVISQDEPIITHVAPAPYPQPATNVTIHRKELSQDARPHVGHSVTPLQLHSASPLESNPPTSKLLERRRQLPQVDTVDPERSGVQRLTPSPTSANDANKQLPTRSIPETVQAAVSAAPAVKRKPASRNQSKSGDEILNVAYGEHTEKAKEFNQLIDSGETIQYTLTPQHIRSYQGSQATLQDSQPMPPPVDSKAVYSGSNGLIPNKQRSTSRPVIGFPVKIPRGAIPMGSRQTTTRSGMAPREAKTVSESLREFADFMRNTGPEPNQANGNIRASASMSNIKPGKLGPQPVRRQDIAAQPGVAHMPSGTRSPTSTATRIGSSQSSSRRSGPKLVARDPQASRDGVSDLINFIREDTASAPPVGNRVTSGASFGGSVNSTQESFKTNSGISSTNSHTGLLAGGRSSGGYMGGATEEPMMPVRKSRKPRDPYAIDDDDLIEELEEDGGGNEESLADFLNSQSARADHSHPPRLSSNGPKAAPIGGGRGPNAVKVSSIGRPIGPGGIPNRASLQARAPSTQGSSGTQDLADFLKNSGPPPGAISRAPEEEGSKKGGFGKMFGGRRQRV